MKVFNHSESSYVRQKLRNDMPLAERLLWLNLKGEALGCKFRRQHGIGPYIADFYCPEKRLVIEVDGDSHFEPGSQEHDLRRDLYMNGLGINVLPQ